MRLFNEQWLLFALIQQLEKIEEQLPDDKWDEHHWKGVKVGLIKAIAIVMGIELHYALTSQDIRKIVIKRGIH